MPETLIVTGGTGLLGSHFVLDRLAAGHRVIALVRPAALHPRERMLASLCTAARACGEAAEPDAWSERLQVVSANLAEPDLGLPAGRLPGNPRPTECWHFAASLLFREHQREAILDQNVEGTGRVLDLAVANGVARFVHVSSAYAAGRTCGDIAEALFPRGLTHHNVYEESKHRAEWLVADRCEHLAMDWRIVRPSVVVGHSRTLRPGQNQRGFYGFVRELYLLRDTIREQGRPRIVADPAAEIDLIPIDAVLADLRFLIEHGFPGGPVYHTTAAGTHRLDYLFGAASEIIGIEPPILVPDESHLVSPIDRVIHERALFYRSYMRSPKRFARSLPGTPAPSRMQIEGMTHEYLRGLAGHSYDSLTPPRRIIARDGLALNVFADPDDSKPSVLLCNAYGMPAEFWAPVTRQLLPHFRILTWESRFVPETGAAFAADRCDLDWHLRDAVSVLDGCQVATAVVVGWSTGARLALRLALRHPRRVRGLVLLNGSYNFRDGIGACAPTMTVLDLARRIVANPRYAAFYHRYLYAGDASEGGLSDTWTARKRISEVLSRTDPELIHLLNTPWRTEESMRRFAHMFASYYDEVDEAALSAISCPTLVIACGGDAFASPAASEHAAHLIPGARFALLPDGDHYALYTRDEIAAWTLEHCVHASASREDTRAGSAP